MSKFKIEWLEQKQTAGGKQYAKITLKDEAGAKFDDIAIWGDFPGFAGLSAGSEVEGSLKEGKPYNGKPSYVLYPQQSDKPKGGGGAGVKAAQDRKEVMVEKAQTRKENGIELAATQRDAVLIVTTFYPEFAELKGDEKKMAIAREYKAWRKWLSDNFGEPTK